MSPWYLLAVMDEVQTKRESIVITKRGKAVAKLVPADESDGGIYNFLRGRGKITGDVIGPALSADEWGNLV